MSLLAMSHTPLRLDHRRIEAVAEALSDMGWEAFTLLDRVEPEYEVLRKLHEGVKLEDLCFSLLETAYTMLAEVAERALAHTGKKSLLLTGGVARSRRLQEILRAVAEEHDASFHVVPPEYAGDNGVMIAWTGALAYSHGLSTPVEASFVKPRWRLDEVEVPWRS